MSTPAGNGGRNYFAVLLDLDVRATFLG